jgi:membrane protein
MGEDATEGLRATPEDRARARAPLSVARMSDLWGFLRYTARRFGENGCTRIAAGLSYVTLLSLVPLFAIGLSMLAAFPAFTEARQQLKDLVLDFIPPESAERATEQFTLFLENAENLTVPGVLALGVTVILLLHNINGAFNAIWRVSEPRPLAIRLLVYWALLTLGPLLLGTSLSLSSYAYAVVQDSDLAIFGSGLVEASRLIAVTLAAVGFALLFFIVPNRPVRPLHALAGGMVAALLLEGLKFGFSLYISQFDSYQVLYGALASVPIFLVWTYLAWTVVLVGAEVAASLPEWRSIDRRGLIAQSASERLALALAILHQLRSASRRGEGLRQGRLYRSFRVSPTEMDHTLNLLRRNGYVARTLGGRVVLLRDLASVTLGRLADDIGFAAAPGGDWATPVQQTLTMVTEANRSVLSRPLSELLDQEPPSGRLGELHAVEPGRAEEGERLTP